MASVSSVGVLMSISSSRLRALGIALLLGASVSSAAAAPMPNQMLPKLHWRLLGPFRGGWATMGVGVPSRPNLYYIGTAGGGVWRTENAGRTWTALTNRIGAASIGAIAVAPSNPSVLYVGTGQVAPRYDIAAGDGMYRSNDGGVHWTHIGLSKTRHIGAIWVNPTNADEVVVAALGRVFASSQSRGLYRSVDGGKTWQHVLFVDQDTGGVDLAADPAHPGTLYAALWSIRNYPWLSYFKPIAGKGSAIYVSHDAGKTWARLGGLGWPNGALGRIGLAVTDTTQGTRIYASIDGGSDHGATGLWRSDDGGAHWRRVNAHTQVANWYSSRLSVMPGHPDTVFTTGQSVRESTDGGVTFRIVKGAPGGDDYHFVWINPLHPNDRIVTSDQGAAVTMDGGKTWSSWYNQPTAQVYHLAADNRFPFWIYAGQQDSGTFAIASASNYGLLSYRDWHPVGGDERDYDIPYPIDPDIVFGTGLGGRVSRWDSRTGQVQNVSPWPVMSYGARPDTVKYRYTWITPLAIGQQRPYPIYVGAQVLFRSVDQGAHWQVISPDLTGAVPGTPGCGHVGSLAHAKACGYGVIYSIALAPSDADTIWTGSDDGQVEVTHDAGLHWSNVTPSAVPLWARIDSIDVSAQDPSEVYLAVDDHRDGNDMPMAFRTDDGGKTWKSITRGLPAGHYVTVVRADPLRRGLLYAGTDVGVYVSFDNGSNWQPLQYNLPTAWIRDLLVHGNDLVAGTQGRAIWVLDDITPLREVKPDIDQQAVHLFAPAVAVRLHADNNKDTPLPPDTPIGHNPPDGAVFDYWLGSHVHGPVTLKIVDAQGQVLRSFSSEAKPAELPADRYFSAGWIKPTPRLGDGPGMHRFIWSLHLPRPQAVRYHYSIAAVWGRNTPLEPRGARVLPGNYTVELQADGRTSRQTLIVSEDPRVHATPAELRALFGFQQQLAMAMHRSYVGDGQVQAVLRQLDARQPSLAAHARALHAANVLREALSSSAGSLATRFGKANGELAALATDAGSADRPPTSAQEAVYAANVKAISMAGVDWRRIEQGPLRDLNRILLADHLGTISVPAAAVVKVPQGPAGIDLP